MIETNDWRTIVEKWIPIAEAYHPIHKSGNTIGDHVRKSILGINPDTKDFHAIPNEFSEIKASPKQLQNFIRIFEELAKIRCLQVNLGSGTTGYRTKLLARLKSKDLNKDGEKTLAEISQNQWNTIQTTHQFVINLRQFVQKKLDNLPAAIVQFCNDFQSSSTTSIEEPIYKGLNSYFIKFFACIFPDEILPIFRKKDLQKYLSYFLPPSSLPKITNSFPSRLAAAYHLNLQVHQKLIPILPTSPSKIYATHIVSFLYRFSYFINEKNPKEPFHHILYENLHELGYDSYPIDEQAFVGIFLAIQHKKTFKKMFNPKLDLCSYYKIAEDYPDIIAKNKTGETIYIELEYDLCRYNHEDQEKRYEFQKKTNYFIICWKDDKNEISQYSTDEYSNTPIIIENILKVKLFT